MSISKLPDFESLAIYAKVVEQRSFATAAQGMDVSVATLSRTVTHASNCWLLIALGRWLTPDQGLGAPGYVGKLCD